MSFMIVRLLQTFDAVELDMSAQPADSQPPPSWKNVPGRQSTERFFPKCHLTMYAHVSNLLLPLLRTFLCFLSFSGQNGLAQLFVCSFNRKGSGCACVKRPTEGRKRIIWPIQAYLSLNFLDFNFDQISKYTNQRCITDGSMYMYTFTVVFKTILLKSILLYSILLSQLSIQIIV